MASSDSETFVLSILMDLLHSTMGTIQNDNQFKVKTCKNDANEGGTANGCDIYNGTGNSSDCYEIEDKQLNDREKDQTLTETELIVSQNNDAKKAFVQALDLHLSSPSIYENSETSLKLDDTKCILEEAVRKETVHFSSPIASVHEYFTYVSQESCGTTQSLDDTSLSNEALSCSMEKDDKIQIEKTEKTARGWPILMTPAGDCTNSFLTAVESKPCLDKQDEQDLTKATITEKVCDKIDLCCEKSHSVGMSILNNTRKDMGETSMLHKLETNSISSGIETFAKIFIGLNSSSELYGDATSEFPSTHKASDDCFADNSPSPTLDSKPNRNDSDNIELIIIDPTLAEKGKTENFEVEEVTDTDGKFSGTSGHIKQFEQKNTEQAAKEEKQMLEMEPSHQGISDPETQTECKSSQDLFVNSPSPTLDSKSNNSDIDNMEIIITDPTQAEKSKTESLEVKEITDTDGKFSGTTGQIKHFELNTTEDTAKEKQQMFEMEPSHQDISDPETQIEFSSSQDLFVNIDEEDLSSKDEIQLVDNPCISHKLSQTEQYISDIPVSEDIHNGKRKANSQDQLVFVAKKSKTDDIKYLKELKTLKRSILTQDAAKDVCPQKQPRFSESNTCHAISKSVPKTLKCLAVEKLEDSKEIVVWESNPEKTSSETSSCDQYADKKSKTMFEYVDPVQNYFEIDKEKSITVIENINVECDSFKEETQKEDKETVDTEKVEENATKKTFPSEVDPKITLSQEDRELKTSSDKADSYKLVHKKVAVIGSSCNIENKDIKPVDNTELKHEQEHTNISEKVEDQRPEMNRNDTKKVLDVPQHHEVHDNSAVCVLKIEGLKEATYQNTEIKRNDTIEVLHLNQKHEQVHDTSAIGILKIEGLEEALSRNTEITRSGTKKVLNVDQMSSCGRKDKAVTDEVISTVLETETKVLCDASFISATEYLSQSSQGSSTGFIYDQNKVQDCLCSSSDSSTVCFDIQCNTETINNAGINIDPEMKTYVEVFAETDASYFSKETKFTTGQITDIDINVDTEILDAMVSRAVDQLVTEDEITHDERIVDEVPDDKLAAKVQTEDPDSISLYDNHEECKGKFYSCDVDLCDETDHPLCSPVDKRGSSDTQYRSGRCFKWTYAPSISTDNAVPEADDDDKTITIKPIQTCTKPIRLGLSKKQQPIHRLHKF